MPKFRKKPLIVEAVQFIFEPERCKELADFLPDGIAPHAIDHGNEYVLDIPTKEGTMRAYEGDWIVRGAAGELYPVKEDIFPLTFELYQESPGYKGKIVNGYDDKGGLWFSKETNSEQELHAALREARETPEVTVIEIRE